MNRNSPPAPLSDFRLVALTQGNATKKTNQSGMVELRSRLILRATSSIKSGAQYFAASNVPFDRPLAMNPKPRLVLEVVEASRARVCKRTRPREDAMTSFDCSRGAS